MTNSVKTKRFIRLPVVEDRSGLKRERIRQLEGEGKFPARVQLSDRAVGWVESEVEAWIQERIAASRGGK